MAGINALPDAPVSRGGTFRGSIYPDGAGWAWAKSTERSKTTGLTSFPRLGWFIRRVSTHVAGTAFSHRLATINPSTG